MTILLILFQASFLELIFGFNLCGTANFQEIPF